MHRGLEEGFGGVFEHNARMRVESNISPFASLPTVCGTDKYTLDYTNMTADDWEIKPETIKFEFEMSADHSVVNKIDECIPSLRGKRIKVTCEEIEE